MIGNFIAQGRLISKAGNVTEWYVRKDGEIVLDPQVKAMFAGIVMPVMRQLPTDVLSEMRDYMVEEINNELASRKDDDAVSPSTAG